MVIDIKNSDLKFSNASFKKRCVFSCKAFFLLSLGCCVFLSMSALWCEGKGLALESDTAALRPWLNRTLAHCDSHGSVGYS